MNAKALLGSLVSLLAVNWCSAQPQPGTVLWTYEISTIADVALSRDGTVYVGGYGNLYAITNDGTSASHKWIFSFSPALVKGIAVGSDNTIYVGNASQFFYAVNPNGTVKWAYEHADSSQPALGYDGTIYVSGGGGLLALSPNGNKKWSYQVWDNRGTIAVGHDGTIYFCNQQSPATLFALNPNGTLKWSLSSGSGSEPYLIGAGPLAIGSDGVVLSGGPELHAFNPDGSLRWQNSTNGSYGPVIDLGGNIYVNKGYDSTLSGLDSTGAYLWQTPFAFRCGFRFCVNPAVPAIDSGGNIYYTAPNGIFCLNSTGQINWSLPHPNPGAHPILSTTSPAIAPDGTIYATVTNTLFAIAGTNPPAKSPWPMYQQNAQRTGKLEKPALLNPQRYEDANFAFQLYAPLGQTNLVETSTNLTSWTPLTNVVITNVPMDVIDLTASNSPTRFYRAVVP